MDSNGLKTACGTGVIEDTVTVVSYSSLPIDSPSSLSTSRSYRRTMSSNDKLNSTSIYCRICHEDEGTEELVDPCKCAGSLGLVHCSCLEKWLSTANTDRCEICKYMFTIQKRHKPIAQWWRSVNAYGPRGITGDALCLTILTPLCIAATYLCALGASAYSRLGYWEGTGLAVLCTLLVATYCLWLTITLRFHYKIWRRWRSQNHDVVLLVKHFSADVDRSKNLVNEKSEDKNNNSDRTTAPILFGVSFTHEEDPVYTMRQHTTFV